MITLRPLTIADQKLLALYLNNPNVIQYLSSNIPHPYSEQDAKWFIETGSKTDAINQAIVYQQQFCGVIGIYLQANEYAHSAELGYWIGEDFWQQGIATQAVKQFCRQIFFTSNITRIFNPVTAQNIPSIRVMEKAGFTLEGVLKHSVAKDGQLANEHLYSLIKT